MPARPNNLFERVVIEELPAVIERLASRAPVASPLRTADWERLPLALRERAQFSAGVEEVKIVGGISEKLGEWAEFVKRDPQRAYMDRSRFVAEMRGLLGAEPGDTGRLTDIASRRRLELIYNFQTEDAASYARWQTEHADPDILDAFPAQELIRVEPRLKPRDWESRWEEAGGSLFEGRMIARKDDPIWVRISRFGKPWPPFDFGSGMGVQDVERSEAEALGVIKPSDRIRSQAEDFNRDLEASVANLSPKQITLLEEIFGDQIEIEGNVVRWGKTN